MVSGSTVTSPSTPTKDRLLQSGVLIKYTTNQSILEFIHANDLPTSCGGHFEHNQIEWKEFFTTLEPLQNQCLSAGRRLISVLSEIRTSDGQGAPNRRQLHSQHRALSRALMDTELQNLRRNGAATIRRLTDRARRISRIINNKKSLTTTKTEDEENNGNSTTNLPDATEHIIVASSSNNNNNSNNVSHNSNCKEEPSCEVPDYVEARLNEVITVFNEVDRAARRLESLTEQRRERIREMTRQKAVEEEISEVSTFLHVNPFSFYLKNALKVN